MTIYSNPPLASVDVNSIKDKWKLFPQSTIREVYLRKYQILTNLLKNWREVSFLVVNMNIYANFPSLQIIE